MGLWMPYPRSFPAACCRCGRGERDHGPYLEVDSPPIYLVPQARTSDNKDRQGRQYFCRDCYMADAFAEGSPLEQILAERLRPIVEAHQAEVEELQRKAEPVTAMVDEIRRQVGRDRQRRHSGSSEVSSSAEPQQQQPQQQRRQEVKK